MVDSDTVKVSAMVTLSSDETTPTHETVGGVTSGIVGVAVQRRESGDPATESPDTVTITTGGRGTVGGRGYTIVKANTTTYS